MRLKTLLFALTLCTVLSCNKDEDVTPRLLACFSVPTGEFVTGQQITFTSCSQLATTFTWTFGDGTTSAEQNPQHAYNTAGQFIVKLVVSDGKSTNETTQTITVKAGTGSAGTCIKHFGFITKDEVWEAGCHLVDNWVDVRNGATLTIKPGATVKFVDGGAIHAGFDATGNLIAEGTATQPIIFTSSSATPAPGSWEGVGFGPYSTISSLKYCKFEFGGLDLFDDPSAMLDVYDGGKVKVDFCEFRKSSNYAVAIDDVSKFVLFTNNKISENDGYAIFATGNSAGSIGDGNVIENKGVLIDSHAVTESVTWRGLTCPYVTASNLWVGSDVGNTLTLEAGVRIEFIDRTMLLPRYSTTKATLIVNGTAAKPVVFTTHDPASTTGWGGISMSSGFTSDTYFKYAVIEKAIYNGENNGVVTVGAMKLNMENCKISGSKQYGIIMGSAAQLGIFRNNDIGSVGTFSMNLQKQNLLSIADGNTFSGNKNVQISFADITENIVFPALPVYYHIRSDMFVGSTAGATATLNPGSKFLMENSSWTIAGNRSFESVPGKLVAVGTSANPIIFERITVNGNNTHFVGFIGTQTNTGSIMEYCRLTGASIAIRVDNVYNAATNLYPTIRNNTITNCTSYAIYIANSFPKVENNTMTGNAFNEVKYQ